MRNVSCKNTQQHVLLTSQSKYPTARGLDHKATLHIPFSRFIPTPCFTPALLSIRFPFILFILLFFPSSFGHFLCLFISFLSFTLSSINILLVIPYRSFTVPLSFLPSFPSNFVSSPPLILFRFPASSYISLPIFSMPYLSLHLYVFLSVVLPSLSVLSSPIHYSNPYHHKFG